MYISIKVSDFKSIYIKFIYKISRAYYLRSRVKLRLLNKLNTGDLITIKKNLQKARKRMRTLIIKL